MIVFSTRRQTEWVGGWAGGGNGGEGEGSLGGSIVPVRWRRAREEVEGLGRTKELLGGREKGGGDRGIRGANQRRG